MRYQILITAVKITLRISLFHGSYKLYFVAQELTIHYYFVLNRRLKGDYDEVVKKNQELENRILQLVIILMSGSRKYHTPRKGHWKFQGREGGS